MVMGATCTFATSRILLAAHGNGNVLLGNNFLSLYPATKQAILKVFFWDFDKCFFGTYLGQGVILCGLRL